MIEEVIRNLLTEKLSVPVFLEAKRGLAGKYVLFERTGSDKRNCLMSATYAFQSYADSLYEAAKLNEQVKEAVEGMITHNRFAAINLSSDYNFTDTETKKYRYQAVYDINYY